MERSTNRTKNDYINVLILIKGNELYIFLYDDARRDEALRMLGRCASNPELNFSWYDAAVMSQKIRQDEGQRCSRLDTTLVTDGEELLALMSSMVFAQKC